MARALWEDGHWRTAVVGYVLLALLLAATVTGTVYYSARGGFGYGWFDYFVTAVYAVGAVLLLVRARRQFEPGRYY